jgi:hypothetical protein
MPVTVNVQLDEDRRARVEAIAAREGLSLSDAVRWALDRWSAEAPEAVDALGRVRHAEPNPSGRGGAKRGPRDGPPLKLLNVRLSPAEHERLWRLAEGLGLTTREVAWRAIDAG